MANEDVSRFVCWHGRDEEPEYRHELRAGPVEALLVGPDLRRVKVGDVELAQRVYVAVRDAVWNTIPGEVSDLEVAHGDDHFKVTFTSRHHYEDIDYEWHGEIAGTPDGTITYTMDGEAKNAFTHAKIGFNVHHPLPEYVGAPYRASTPDGEIEGVLPEQIDPQLIRDETLTAMFEYFDALTVELPGGVAANFRFEGDYFETQDHRNWSDANYKTYGTPLSFGFPMDVEEGERFHQKVTISFTGQPLAPKEPGPIEVRLGETQGRPLPSLGLGMAGDTRHLTERETALLSRARPDHLRIDLHVGDPTHQAALDRGEDACRALGASMELALFVTEGSETELQALAKRLDASDVPVARILVFEEAEGFSAMRGTTPPTLVDLVRRALGSPEGGAPIAGGTDQFFNELNRVRPDPDPIDAVAFSLNPQVHACDDMSVMDNVTPLEDIAASTRAICGDLPIFVTPVTLIGRSGPFPAGPPDPNGLPGPVDVRQAALFGAAWTVGSIAGFANAAVDSVTYFETVGWKGLVETDEGPPNPELFPSRPGDVYPLYHVFADVAEWKDGQLVGTTVSDPFTVSALAVADGAGTHVLLANRTLDIQRVRLRSDVGGPARVRTLDDSTCRSAMGSPTEYREAPSAEHPLRNGELDLTLPPYSVTRLDITS